MINKATIVNKFEFHKSVTPDMVISVKFGDCDDEVEGLKGSSEFDRIGDSVGMTPNIQIAAWFVADEIADIKSNTFAKIDDVEYLVGQMSPDAMGALQRIYFLDRDFVS